MAYNPNNPIIVQGDKTILVEVNNDLYEEVRNEVGRFAELEKSPEYMHTYRISFLSLWNAASSGIDAKEIVSEEPEKEMEFSGILIQPNYEVVVAAGGMQEVHTLYLDRFAEKVSGGVVNVYKLSFKAVASALDQSIPVQELIDYFLEFSVNPLPENVLLTLQEWERDSKKIRIRTVTILDMDDQYLLEELKSYKTIRNYIRSDLHYVLEIDEKSAKKLKREIEKKNRFCLMEPTGK